MQQTRFLVPALLLTACALEPSNDPRTAAVQVTPETASLVVGGHVQLSATVTVDGWTTTQAGQTWTTSNPAVATVSATGLVTGVGAGDAVISAHYGKASDNGAVIVFGPPALIAFATDSIAIPPRWRGVTPIAVQDKFGRDLWAGTMEDLFQQGFAVASSDPRVVAIRGTGTEVTFDAVGQGVATISATLGTLFAKLHVAVRPLEGVLSVSQRSDKRLVRIRMDGSAPEPFLAETFADTLWIGSLSWAGDSLLFDCGTYQVCVYDRRRARIDRIGEHGFGYDPAWIPGMDRFSYVADGEGVRSYQPSSGTVVDIYRDPYYGGPARVSRQGLLAINCSADDYSVCLWNGQGLLHPDGLCASVSMAFTNRGDVLAAACVQGQGIDLVETANLRAIRRLRPLAGGTVIRAMAWDPSDQLIAFGGDRLWVLTRDETLQMRPLDQEAEAFAVVWEPPAVSPHSWHGDAKLTATRRRRRILGGSTFPELER